MSDERAEAEGAPESPLTAEALGERAREVAAHVNSALNGVADATGLTEKVQRSPYGMVGAALGVGYVLGGGLFTPTTMRLLRMGAKLAAVPMVRERLLDVAEAAVDGLVAQLRGSEDDAPADDAGETDTTGKE